MDTSLQTPADRRREDHDTANLPRSIIAYGVAMFLIIGLFIAAPRATPALLLCLAAIFVAHTYKNAALPQAITPTPLLLNLGLFGLYMAINASWSLLPLLAYAKIALFFLFAAMTTIGVTALHGAQRNFLERLALNMVLATAIFAVLMAIEVLLQMPLRRAIVNMFPILMPSLKHVVITDGVVTNIAAYKLNRSAATLLLALWPTLMVMSVVLRRRLAILSALALFIISGVAILFSEHETSKIGLIFSSAVFLLALRLPRLALGLSAAGWIVATMAVVPIAMIAFQQKLQFSPFIPDTGRARIIIWGYTAQQVLKHPVAGIGMQSTRIKDETRKDPIVQPDGFNYPLRTNRHAHNIYLQNWYELGGLGALALCLSGLLILRRIASFAADIIPYALAVFVSAAVIAAFSWGMWAPWFMASFTMTTLITMFGVETVRGRTS